MKLFLAAFAVVIATCVFFPQGSTGQESESTTPLPELAAAGNPRFFFFNSGDPCTNMLYQMLNITDAKCSLQCYIQAGYQQGGYCDDNQVCQCNQIA